MIPITNKRYAISEAVGIAVIYAAAVLLHFIYQMSGGSTLAIIFGAVNESVWEHTKIFAAAYCGYALLQLLWIRVPFRRYLVAKCCGLYVLVGGIIGFFYLYTSFSGKAILWLDIISSAVLVAAAQLCSYLITVRARHTGDLFIPALLLLMLYYLMFFSFSVFPPHTELFRDPSTGGYGIPDAPAQPTEALRI